MVDFMNKEEHLKEVANLKTTSKMETERSKVGSDSRQELCKDDQTQKGNSESMDSSSSQAGGQTWSYTNDFKLSVVCFAKTYGTRAAALCCKLDKKLVKEWKKNEDVLRNDDPPSLKIKLVGDYSLRRAKQKDYSGMESDSQTTCSSTCSSSPVKKGCINRSYTIEFKLRVIEFSKSHNITVTASHFNINRKQVRDWKKKEAKFRAAGKPNARRISGNSTVQAVQKRKDKSETTEVIEKFKRPSSHKGQHIGSYTIEFKLTVVDYAKTHNISATANHFGIDRKQVRDWKRQEEKLRNMDNPETRKALKGKGRKLGFPLIDAELSNWLKEQQGKGEVITDKVLKLRASRLHMEKGDLNFQASAGWFRSFCRRHDVNLPKGGRRGRPSLSVYL